LKGDGQNPALNVEAAGPILKRNRETPKEIQDKFEDADK
jgi:hypothetical protein